MSNNYNDFRDMYKLDYEELESQRQENYRITSLNKKRIKNLKRKAIKRVALTGIIALSIAVGKYIIDKPPTLDSVVPDGYVQIDIEIPVSSNATLSDIAELYYDENSYPEYYTNFDDYMKSIAEKNDLNGYNLPKYQNIYVPVIVAENNVYLERIEQLNNELDTLEDQEWISYTVKVGDSLYELAWKGSGDGNEAEKNLDKIIEKNRLESSTILPGDHIKIINPRMGEIKQEIEYLDNQLKSSLIVDKQDDNSEKYSK